MDANGMGDDDILDSLWAPTFWGVEVKPGKTTPFVPPPFDANLHISQATLSMDAKPGQKVGLTCKVDEDMEGILMCTLREGGCESQSLDLIYDSYTEFNVIGDASVHLTGYYMKEDDDNDLDDDDDDEDDDEDDIAALTEEDLENFENYQRMKRMGLIRAGEDDDDEDDDDDDDEDDDEDDDDEDDEDEMDDEETEAALRRMGVHITELNHDGTEKADGDDDEDEEDEDDDEDEEDDGGLVVVPATAGAPDKDGEDEDDEDDDDKEGKETTAVPVTVAGDASAAKRKAAQVPEEAPAKKAKRDIVVQGPDDTPMPAVTEAPKQLSKAAKKKEKKRKAEEAAAAAAGTAVAAQDEGEAAPAAGARAGGGNVRRFDNGFILEDLGMGQPDGKPAKAGAKVSVRYVGKLASNGKVFDQTKGSKTFSFRVGTGEVIKAWDRGVVGMRVGDKRRITAPPQMAYGSSGIKGVIPPNATLVFDVELVDVKGK